MRRRRPSRPGRCGRARWRRCRSRARRAAAVLGRTSSLSIPSLSPSSARGRAHQRAIPLRRGRRPRSVLLGAADHRDLGDRVDAGRDELGHRRTGSLERVQRGEAALLHRGRGEPGRPATSPTAKMCGTLVRYSSSTAMRPRLSASSPPSRARAPRSRPGGRWRRARSRRGSLPGREARDRGALAARRPRPPR